LTHDSSEGEDNMPVDRIRLLIVAFSAFSVIGKAFGPEVQEDVPAVSVSLYVDQSYMDRVCRFRVINFHITRASEGRPQWYRRRLSDFTIPGLKAMLDAPSDPKLSRSDSQVRQTGPWINLGVLDEMS